MGVATLVRSSPIRVPRNLAEWRSPQAGRTPGRDRLEKGTGIDRDEYISVGRNTVGGWFGQADGLLFCALSEATDGRGDLLETGAYLGRSSILLGYLVRSGERLVVCDLFGVDAGDPANDSENQLREATMPPGVRKLTARFHE